MRYFFYLDQENDAHIIVARSLESAQSIAEKAGLKSMCFYELGSETFKDEGFLI